MLTACSIGSYWTKVRQCFGLGMCILAVSVYGQPRLDSNRIVFDADLETGAERLLIDWQKLEGKRLALVANHTAMIGDSHLVDMLLARGLNITRVFAPEHGFRGTADAGKLVASITDPVTGIPITSLYGSRKKPKPSDLTNVDLILFDIQDVGVRYYTYISTMHYVMEACAEADIPFWVLDRPNPNGFYVDGPVLQEEFSSFVGLHPIPLVHGLTVGELARMINGEGWLKGGMTCDLQVITCGGYSHKDFYQLPIPPSPNLPNMSAIYLYPSLGLFEGTEIGVGRGTDFPFQVIGSPVLGIGDFYFTPEPKPGAKKPRFNGEQCRGFDLRHLGSDFTFDIQGIYLRWLLTTYSHYPERGSYFLKSRFFDLLAGSDRLRTQVETGAGEEVIRASWEEELERFREKRASYLLYEDFE